MKELDTQQIVIKIPPEEIVFVDMIFKSCSGLAMLKLNHKEKGVVNLDVTAGTRAEVLDILQNLKKQFSLIFLNK